MTPLSLLTSAPELRRLTWPDFPPSNPALPSALPRTLGQTPVSPLGRFLRGADPLALHVCPAEPAWIRKFCLPVLALLLQLPGTVPSCSCSVGAHGGPLCPRARLWTPLTLPRAAPALPCCP